MICGSHDRHHHHDLDHVGVSENEGSQKFIPQKVLLFAQLFFLLVLHFFPSAVHHEIADKEFFKRYKASLLLGLWHLTKLRHFADDTKILDLLDSWAFSRAVLGAACIR